MKDDDNTCKQKSAEGLGSTGISRSRLIKLSLKEEDNCGSVIIQQNQKRRLEKQTVTTLSFSLCKMTSLTELHHFTCNGSHTLFPAANRAVSSFPTFLNSRNLSIKRRISGNGSTRRWRSRCSVSTVTPPVKDVGSDGGESLLDCVIVGAGISGLCIAQALATKHQDQVPNVLVTEARDRVGGNIITVERDGFLWEEGPNSFQPSDPMLTMVVCLRAQLGLGFTQFCCSSQILHFLLAFCILCLA